MIVQWITLCMCVGDNMIRINCSHRIAGSRVSDLVLFSCQIPPPQIGIVPFSLPVSYIGEGLSPFSLTTDRIVWLLILMAEVYQYCFHMIPFLSEFEHLAIF